MTMEYREFEIRKIDAEARTVEGVAVPYGQVTNTRGYAEQFVRGAFGDNPAGVPLYHSHNHQQGALPIGVVTEARDAEDGLHIKAKISQTPAGDEVYQLAKDGALSKFSVGFSPTDGGTETRDGVVTRTGAQLHEVSLVGIPAYSGAAVTDVRSAEDSSNTNTETDSVVDLNTAPEIVEVRDGLADLERKFATINVNAGAPAASQFRNAGHWLKGFAADSNDAAVQEIRTYAGGTMATGSSGRATWIDRMLQFVAQNRYTVSAFARAGLPEQGSTLTWPKVASTSGAAAAQALEGDALGIVNLVTGLGTASIGTYGVSTGLSRQVIERSDEQFLDASLRLQALSYAKVTEAVVRGVLTGASGTNTVAVGATVAAATAKQWIAAAITASAAIEDNSYGLNPEFLIVSRDVFGALFTLVDSTGRPMFEIDNPSGVNSLGDGSIVHAQGNIGGLPIVVGPLLPAGTAIVASSQALITWESAGAPVSLLHDNVTTLTRDFALYGYLASAVVDPKGLSVLTFP